MLGLALAAALWWIIFGRDDEERAEQALTAAPQRAAHRAGPVRAVLRQHPAAARAWSRWPRACRQAIGHGGQRRGRARRAAAVLAAGAALFLAGDVTFRRLLRHGPVRLRAWPRAALAAALVGARRRSRCSWAVIALLAAMLSLERYWP